MAHTREELLSAVRADHPEFKDVADEPLYQAVIKDHPELTPSVAAGPTKRPAPGEVATDQIKAVGESSGLAGLSRLLTHPVDTLTSTASEVAAHPVDSAIGALGGVLKAVPNGIAGLARVAANTAQNISHDLPPQIRVGLGQPANVPAPTREQNIAAGHAAGDVVAAVPAVAGMAELGNAGIRAVNDALSSSEMAAKLWNEVAKVKGGRQGTQMDMATGAFKTLPGRSMVDSSASPLSETFRAALSKPNTVTQSVAYTKLRNAGDALGGQLAKSTVPIDIIEDLPLGDKKLMSALRDAKALPESQDVNSLISEGGKAKALKVTPTQANAVKSAIGERINWNPNVLTDANEALKDAYFSIQQKIATQVPGIAPYLNDWQESYLFNKALQGTMEKAASKTPLIPPIIKTGLKGAGLTAAGAAGLYEAGKALQK